MKKASLSPVLLALCLVVQPLAWTQAHAGDNAITSLHSNINMHLGLAMKKNMAACVAQGCETNRAFDKRVQEIGQKLAVTAYDLYPNLEKKSSNFQFNIVDKEAAGMASNAGGNIVLFRGLQNLALNDEALSFIIAREMGHVIGQHHKRNTSTKLIISAVATFIFPVAGILGVSSTAAQASSVSSIVTSVASTATSFVGGKVAMLSVKPKQLAEADAYANSMLESHGLDYHLVFNGLPVLDDNATSWLKDLHKSKVKLRSRLKIQGHSTALAMATY